MATTGQFYLNEQLSSTDLQNALSLLASSFNTLVNNTMYNTSFVIINGLGVTQTSTADNGVQVGSGLAFQNGQTVLLASQQGVNILPGSYANGGAGLAADSTNPRIDVVYIEYAQQQTNAQSRTFNPPGQSSYSNTVYTELSDGYTLSVVHGAAAASPVAPSAPVGTVVLAQVTVPANATTITTSDIADMTSTYRNDGGRLALATNNLLQYVDGATLGTPSGFTLKVGTNDYIKDNTTTHRMDMQGGTNGINMLSSVLYSLSGTPIVLQPTTDATSGTHVLSLKNASGTEYGYADNTGLFSGSFKGDGSGLTSVHAANSDELGGIVAANFFRTDAGAPNPQTVANPVELATFTTIGDSTNGYIQVRTDSTAIYLETINGAQTASKTLKLVGLNANDTPVETGANTLDDGSGNMTVAGSITSSGGANFVGSQIFTASGTFTVPSGVSRVFVQTWGGGGGGGWGNGAVAGGGGGAGYAEGWVQVSNGQQISVTVGTGGAGTSGTNFIGSPGGISSFGSYVQATGGGGGVGTSGSETGGNGGNGTYGTLLQAGSMGDSGSPYNGGNAATTFGGTGGTGSSTGDGSAGYAPGGGGGGSYGTVGGSGARGEVRVYY